MYEPNYINCRSCRKALLKQNFPAAYVLERYRQWCTACIQVDQVRKAAAATASRHDAPDVWAHRDAVLAAQQTARTVPGDMAVDHLAGLLRAAVASSDDVPALLDTIAELKREVASLERGLRVATAAVVAS